MQPLTAADKQRFELPLVRGPMPNVRAAAKSLVDRTLVEADGGDETAALRHLNRALA